MHFSREKLKEQAGWIILGLVVLVALGFLGFQEMNGRVIEAQRDATQWGDEAMVAREEASRCQIENYDGLARMRPGGIVEKLGGRGSVGCCSCGRVKQWMLVANMGRQRRE